MKFPNIVRKFKEILSLEYFKSSIPLSSIHNLSLKIMGDPSCKHVYFFQAQVWLKTGRKQFELNEKSVCKFCKDERFDKVSTPR